jgi:hypothetical protein
VVRDYFIAGCSERVAEKRGIHRRAFVLTATDGNYFRETINEIDGLDKTDVAVFQPEGRPVVGRGEQQKLDANGAAATSLSNQHLANSNDLFSTLAPAYKAEAANPQGFGKADLDTMNTASQQSVGGSTAGLVGQGMLTAARTRNVGGNSAALDEAARIGDRTLSQNAVEIQANNAALKEKQRQEGLAGLTSLYGGNDAATMQALGLSNDAYDKASRAYVNPTVGLLQSAMQGAGTGAGLAAGCWIADALYGVGSFKANVLRWWLNSVFKHTLLGRVVMSLYLKHGEWAAAKITANPILGIPFMPIFWVAWQFAYTEYIAQEKVYAAD